MIVPNTQTISIVALLFLTTLTLDSQIAVRTHTIYIAGPTVKGNLNWKRESEILYRVLKRDAHKKGNTIELFPKNTYRDSVLTPCKIKHRVPSSKQLSILYTNTDNLLKDLLELIIMRYEEIVTLNDSDTLWSEKIHIKAYGKGGEILIGLIEEEYESLIGTLILFEGDSSSSSSSSSSESNIINITIREEENIIGENSHVGRILGTTSLILGIVVAIVSLL